MTKDDPIIGYAEWQTAFLETFKTLYSSKGNTFLTAVAMNHPKIASSKETEKVISRMNNYRRGYPGNNGYSRVVNLDDLYACCEASELSPNDFLHNVCEHDISIRNTAEILKIITKLCNDRIISGFLKELYKGSDAKNDIAIDLPEDVLFRRLFLAQFLFDFFEKMCSYQEKEFSREVMVQTCCKVTSSLQIKVELWNEIEDYLLEHCPEESIEEMEEILDNLYINAKNSLKIYTNAGKVVNNFEESIPVKTSRMSKTVFYRLLFESAVVTIVNQSMILKLNLKQFLRENTRIGGFICNLFERSLYRINQYLIYDGIGREIRLCETSDYDYNEIFWRFSETTKNSLDTKISNARN